MMLCKIEVINYCITKYGEATYMELAARTALDSIARHLGPRQYIGQADRLKA